MIIWSFEAECWHTRGRWFRETHWRVVRVIIIRKVDCGYRRATTSWEIYRRYSWSRYSNHWRLRSRTESKVFVFLLGFGWRLPGRIKADNRSSSSIADGCWSWKFRTTIASLHARGSSNVVATDLLPVLHGHCLGLNDGRWWCCIAGIWCCFRLFGLPSSSIEWVWSLFWYRGHCVCFLWKWSCNMRQRIGRSGLQWFSLISRAHDIFAPSYQFLRFFKDLIFGIRECCRLIACMSLTAHSAPSTAEVPQLTGIHTSNRLA